MSTSPKTYNVTEQYRNAGNLNARIQLHAHYSQNPYGWMRWVFDHFNLPDNAHILELGSGAGTLWRENCDRIPASWEITLSDFSPGMLQEVRRNLTHLGRPFHFEQIDAQFIPFADAQFDAVIANHMLYYVPDKPKAFAEIRRVLKPEGVLYATTVGQNHLGELRALVERFAPDLVVTPLGAAETATEASFLLENGERQLAPWFSSITLRRYKDALVITDVQPLVDYVMSTETMRVAAPEAFTHFVEKEMVAQGGAIQITKDSGIFICSHIKAA
ncbi:MAG: class I SAM-dependent methyltransferase [Caldilineaceae bacterium]